MPRAEAQASALFKGGEEENLQQYYTTSHLSCLDADLTLSLRSKDTQAPWLPTPRPWILLRCVSTLGATATTCPCETCETNLRWQYYWVGLGVKGCSAHSEGNMIFPSPSKYCRTGNI